MDDSFTRYIAEVNTKDETVALKQFKDKDWTSHLKFQRTPGNQLTLDGEMEHHKIHMQLKLVDRDSFTLVNRGFHWVQELPFQR